MATKSKWQYNGDFGGKFEVQIAHNTIMQLTKVGGFVTDSYQHLFPICVVACTIVANARNLPNIRFKKIVKLIGDVYCHQCLTSFEFTKLSILRIKMGFISIYRSDLIPSEMGPKII